MCFPYEALECKEVAVTLVGNSTQMLHTSLHSIQSNADMVYKQVCDTHNPALDCKTQVECKRCENISKSQLFFKQPHLLIPMHRQVVNLVKL